jgi:ATP-binding cassette subfamily C protein CydC
LDAVFDAAADPRPAVGSRGQAILVLDGDRFIPGSRIALTGPSGCGKTTLVEGLLGLRPLRSGRIGIDGRDAADLPPATLRALFAWAPQEAMLIAGTVRDNLRMADPHATEDRLWQALHDAALDTVVRALPEGLDTWLGDDGARLSGGERRRLRWPAPIWAMRPGCCSTNRARAGRRCRGGGRASPRRPAGADRAGMILVSHRPVLSALCERQWAADDASRRSAA